MDIKSYSQDIALKAKNVAAPFDKEMALTQPNAPFIALEYL